MLELWGLGDLAIATPFLQAAAENFAVTLLAKPFALELQPRLWPTVEVLPFSAPWTAFTKKYQLWRWPWAQLQPLHRQLHERAFAYGVSGRWDPRDHLLLRLAGVKERLGFPRLGSQRLLTRPLARPNPLAHRSEFWRVAGTELGLTVPGREQIVVPARPAQTTVLLHTGARLAARIWPLEHFQRLARRLREELKLTVKVACDADQLAWWQQRGEPVVCPANVAELCDGIDTAGVFIGNCSGPGHLAGIAGVPTFTLYGPSMHEWFLPMHPAAEFFEGKACPYKPCSDYCRYATPYCLANVTPDEVWPQIKVFIARHLPVRREAGQS